MQCFKVNHVGDKKVTLALEGWQGESVREGKEGRSLQAYSVREKSEAMYVYGSELCSKWRNGTSR